MVRKAIGLVGLAVGAFAIFAHAIPGVPGFITCGVAAFVAIVLGTISLVPKQRDRLTTVAAVSGIALATLSLAAWWLVLIQVLEVVMML